MDVCGVCGVGFECSGAFQGAIEHEVAVAAFQSVIYVDGYVHQAGSNQRHDGAEGQ